NRVSNGLDQPGLSMEENLRRLASAPLEFEPGTAWQYSLSTDVLGAVVEKAAGRPLAEAVARYVTRPRRMADTAVGPAAAGRRAGGPARHRKPASGIGGSGPGLQPRCRRPAGPESGRDTTSHRYLAVGRCAGQPLVRRPR